MLKRLVVSSILMGACADSGSKPGLNAADASPVGDAPGNGDAAHAPDAGAGIDAGNRDVAGADRAGLDTRNSALAAFADEVTAITCRKAFECCTAKELATLVGQPVSTPEMCQASYAAVDTDVVEVLIASGTLVFHPEHVAACLAASRTASCAQIFDIVPIPACVPVLAGAKQVGEMCRKGNECVTGRCNGACLPLDGCDNGSSPCPAGAFCKAGRCLPLNDQGAACNDDSQCGPNLYCSDKAVCSPRGGAGAPCGADVALEFITCGSGGGGPCGGDNACADALFCKLAAGTPNGTCTPRPADGAPCSRLRSCRPGSQCDVGGNGTCKPLLPDGAPCTGPGQCKNTCSPDPTSGALTCGSISGTAQCNGPRAPAGGDAGI